jgi:hypothetical protein
VLLEHGLEVHEHAELAHDHRSERRASWRAWCTEARTSFAAATSAGWVLAGVDPVRIARVAGHAKASMSLDEYSGGLLDEPRSELRALRRAVDRLFVDAVEPAEDLSGAGPVQFEEGAEAPASEDFLQTRKIRGEWRIPDSNR